MRARAEESQLSFLDSTLVVSPPSRARARARSLGSQSHRANDARSAQSELPFEHTRTEAQVETLRATLERRLRHAIGHGVVVLAVTDNRRTMVSVRREGEARHIRLHHMFLDAPPEIITALGRYFARNDRFASRLIDRYIAAQQHRIRAVFASDPPPIDPTGMVYDLAEIQRGISVRYFDGRVEVPITWGRHAATQRRRRARRTIRMGTYLIEEQLIRIHPALDQSFVPRYFVEWVVYHEMLHHVVPMPLVNGRRVYHSDEFRARERLYHDYERARAWEETHLTRLISSRRTGPPVRALPF